MPEGVGGFVAPQPTTKNGNKLAKQNALKVNLFFFLILITLI